MMSNAAGQFYPAAKSSRNLRSGDAYRYVWPSGLSLLADVAPIQEFSTRRLMESSACSKKGVVFQCVSRVTTFRGYHSLVDGPAA